MTVAHPVLLVIDVQQGFLEPSWGPSNNPGCEDNIRSLLGLWREREWPVVLVRHYSWEENSPLGPGSPGAEFQEGIAGKSDLLVTKSVNSAFYGTPDLHHWLTEEGYHHLVVCGITTNHCCETTARMAGNLGYQVTFVEDATRAFDAHHPDGTIISACDIARASCASLHGEFATVVSTAELVVSLQS